jgi:hypothetical protein
VATVITVNGKDETLLSPRDFQELIDKHMGFDAAKWFREFVDEHEELESELASVKDDYEDSERRVAELEKERNGEAMFIYVASPLAGDIQGNMEKAKTYSRFVATNGYTPITPHLLYPQFLNDSEETERQIGLRCGFSLISKCDELWVFGETISKGMQGEIEKAQALKMPIHYFDSKCEVRNDD